MGRNVTRYLRCSAVVVPLVILGWGLVSRANERAATRTPLPTDWSHQHVVFSRPATPESAQSVFQDPRFAQQLLRHGQLVQLPLDNPAPSRLPELLRWWQSNRLTTPKIQGDWAMNLGLNATVGAGIFPAKYSFNVTTANCASTGNPDFVVFGTSLSSSGTQASIVAYDNLYKGCTGIVPSTYWGYATNGQILTSPVLPLDGTQIAVVQSSGGLGNVVLLKWKANNGTASAPVTPASKSASAYTSCTAPCMTTIVLHSGLGTPTDDTTSSIFYDYSNDVAWVGGTAGWLHKISPVFKGTATNPPAEVTTGGFPVHMTAGNTLSSPVYDHISNQVFVGDLSGYLYRVDATTGAVVQSGRLAFGTGITESPMLDASQGHVFVFAASDGTSNCNGGTVACSAVYELSTSFGAGTAGSKVTIGSSVAAGNTPNPLYTGAFDSAYFESTNGTGSLYTCGNAGGDPTLYRIPITGGVLGSSSAMAVLAKSGTTPVCAPVTDAYNPYTTGGPTERFFVSVHASGAAPICGNAGCIMSVVDTPWTPSTNYTVGQRILSLSAVGNVVDIQVATTAGTSGSTQPSWGNSATSLRTDGSVVWLNQGTVTPSMANWAASTAYAITSRVVDSRGNVEFATIAGTSGTLQPTWNTAIGQTTLDGSIIWENLGPSPTAGLVATGGSSGIIIDNVSTFTGASQVYFSNLANHGCATSGGNGGCAVQASQSGLN